MPLLNKETAKNYLKKIIKGAFSKKCGIWYCVYNLLDVW